MTAYLLNILDLCFTLHAIHNGATELNPLMQSVPFMVAWKVGAVGFLCWLLRVLAKDIRVPSKARKLSRRGLRFCAAFYAVVNLWHILNLTAIVAA